VGPRNHVLDEVEIHTARGNFGKLSGPLKAFGVSAVMWDHSVVNNGMTAYCNALD